MYAPSWLRRLLFFILLLLSHTTRCHATSDQCIIVRRPVASVVVMKQTIHIVTNVPRDTTFEVNRDLTVTVDNAPTELDIITTFYTTSTYSHHFKQVSYPIHQRLFLLLTWEKDAINGGED